MKMILSVNERKIYRRSSLWAFSLVVSSLIVFLSFLILFHRFVVGGEPISLVINQENLFVWGRILIWTGIVGLFIEGTIPQTIFTILHWGLIIGMVGSRTSMSIVGFIRTFWAISEEGSVKAINSTPLNESDFSTIEFISKRRYGVLSMSLGDILESDPEAMEISEKFNGVNECMVCPKNANSTQWVFPVADTLESSVREGSPICEECLGHILDDAKEHLSQEHPVVIVSKVI